MVFPGPVLSAVRIKTKRGAWGPYPSLSGGWKWVVNMGSGEGALKNVWRCREVTARAP
jgi:hypothetical protein